MSSSCHSIRVLLLEDDPCAARLVKRYLAWSTLPRFEVEHVADLDPGLERLEREPFDLVLADLGLPGSSPESTLAWLSAVSFNLPIVLLTALDDDRLAERAALSGAEDYLVKDRWDARALGRTLFYAVARHRRRTRRSLAARPAQGSTSRN